ncbi:MAG: MFS transporter [bacterium]
MLRAGSRLFSRLFWTFSPFWLFLVLFKFAGGLHYSLLSPLGERLLPLWIVGFIMGGASLIQLLLDVPAGQLLDRFGYRRLLKVTAATFLVAALCLAFELTLATYLISIFLSIFGWLFFSPGINAYILSSAPREFAGKFMSLRDVFGSVGIVISSAALPFTLLLAPSYIGTVLAAGFALAFLALIFAPKDHASVHAEQKIDTHHYYIRRQFLASLRTIRKLNPASSMLLLLSLSSGIFYGIIWFVVPLILAHELHGAILGGIGLGIFDFSVVVLGFVLGTLADRADRRTLVFFGLLVFALFGMLLGLGFGILFILFGFLATAGEEMAGISLWSWLHALDREHAKDGAVAGVITLFDDVGWMIGPACAGVLYGLVGPSWAVIIGALPILVTWAVYWIGFQKHVLPNISFPFVPAKPHHRRHKA